LRGAPTSLFTGGAANQSIRVSGWLHLIFGRHPLSSLTKVFIVLSTVFSLVVSVLIVLMVSKQENYKAQLDSYRTSGVAMQATLNQKTAEAQALSDQVTSMEVKLRDGLQAFQKNAQDATERYAKSEQDRLALQSQLVQIQTQAQSLSQTVDTLQKLLAQKDAQVTDLSPKVAGLTQQYNEVYRANNDLQNQLRQAEMTIRKLQEQIATADTAPKAGAAVSNDTSGQVASLSATRQTTSAINGTVMDIATNAGRTLIETGLGTRDGVKVGTRFAIYRNNSYIGDAVVQRVTPDQSVATVVTTKGGQNAQKGDLVQSGE
jgi:hypothetical protein